MSNIFKNMIGHIYIYIYIRIYMNYKQIHVGDLEMCIFRNLQDTTNMGKLHEVAFPYFQTKYTTEMKHGSIAVSGSLNRW